MDSAAGQEPASVARPADPAGQADSADLAGPADLAGVADLAGLAGVADLARSGGAAGSADRAVTAGAYVMLFLLGVMEGVVGCFYHGSRPVPLTALAFDALLLVTCLLAASGMRRPAGGLLPAMGWFLASFVLATGTKGGSVVIANTSAGKWFLFGGAASAAAGAVAAFARWSRPAPARRRRLARRKAGQ